MHSMMSLATLSSYCNMDEHDSKMVGSSGLSTSLTSALVEVILTIR